jgi:hypothetical protein
VFARACVAIAALQRTVKILKKHERAVKAAKPKMSQTNYLLKIIQKDKQCRVKGQLQA